MKRILSIIAIFIITGSAAVFAEGTPTVDWKNIPSSMKIGDYFSVSDNLSASKTVTAKNLTALSEDEESYLAFEYGMLAKAAFPLKIYNPPGLENGVCESFLPLGAVFKPGTYTISTVVASDFDDETKAVGNPFKVTVAPPDITHNAPSSVNTGQEITLTTQLTNTSLKNQQVSYYKNENNYEEAGEAGTALKNEMTGTTPLMVAYEPVITLTQGADLVTRSAQDYTNTLKSSEKLTFIKPGTVKLTITYKQINTYSYFFKDSELYSPQKNVTITVKGDAVSSSASSSAVSSGTISSGTVSSGSGSGTVSSAVERIVSSDSATGIKITAAEGVFTAGAKLSVSAISSGSNYKKMKSTLSEDTEKFKIYDISFKLSGSTVIPSEKFEISIPVPKGYSGNLTAVYDLTETGKKTAVDAVISGGTAVFETDHTGIFAIAEKFESGGKKKSGTAAVVILVILGTVLLVLAVAGSLILYNYLEKKKKRTRRRNIR